MKKKNFSFLEKFFIGKKNFFSSKKFIFSSWIVFFLIIFYFNIWNFFPVEIKKIPESQIFFDINREKIWEKIFDKKFRHQEIKFSEIPDFLKKAIIQIEDKNFYSNNWIDFFALIRATKNNISEWKIIEWWSTISSQVIRNYFWLNEKRWFWKKLAEFFYAISLNQNYSKEEILEFYLNWIYFWFLNYWIENASEFYFWKELKNLTKAEQIALLVIPKNANKYNPIENPENFRERYEKILNFLNEKKIFNKEEFLLVKNEKLFFQENPEKSSVKEYSRDFLEKQNLEWKEIFSTFDLNLSQKIEEIWISTLRKLERKNVWDFAVIIADKNTNEIKVAIWWKSFFWKNWEYNSVFAKRQVWSTLKPLLYWLAFEKFWYDKNTKILDLPVSFATKENYSYEPKNYSLKYKWEVSLWEALSQSINIPAVKLLDEIWVENFMNFLEKLKINLPEKPDFYWLSLALWTWEISFLKLVQAYSIFTNWWNFCEFTFLKWEKKSCKKILSEKSANEIIEILSDSKVKLDWFPTNSNLDFWNKKIFVKTWTSRNFKDNYSIWFDKNFLIWVWVWNKDWSEMKWVSWASWAWEIFRKIIFHLEEKFWENEEFISENFSDENKNFSDKNFFKITSPLSWTVFKKEEFLSDEQQKIKIDFFAGKNFDEKKIFYDWEEVFWDFLDLEIWRHEVEILFFEGWVEVWRGGSWFLVE